MLVGLSVELCVSDDVAIGAYVEAKAYFLINHYSVLSCFQALEMKSMGMDDGLGLDIPHWASKILDRDSANVFEDIVEDITTDNHVNNPQAEASSSAAPSHADLPLSRRLDNFKPSRTFKYGSCPVHKCARSPHVFGPTAKRAGQAVYACNLFWKRNDANKPCCWHCVPAPREDIKSWPLVQKEKFFSLSSAFRRGGRG